MKAYAELVASKNPASRTTWYRIFYERPSEATAKLRGSYRDPTDAENAAHDEARRRGLELEWVE